MNQARLTEWRAQLFERELSLAVKADELLTLCSGTARMTVAAEELQYRNDRERAALEVERAKLCEAAGRA